MTTTLSTSEHDYILQGVTHNVRVDGRKRQDYRHVTVETGILSNTNGSARLQLNKTSILVGIKVEIGEPLKEAPGCGRFNFSIDGFFPEYMDRDIEAQKLCAQLTRSIERMVDEKSNAFDCKKLCIIPGKQCWVINVDAMICVDGGNLYDALSFAIRSALLDTRVPKVNVIEEEGEQDIELSDNPDDYEVLDLSNWPVLITLTQIGNHFIVDATEEEEKCTAASVLVSVNGKGNVCSMQKKGLGSVEMNNTLDMLECANSVGSKAILAIDKTVQSQHKKEETKNYKKIGFLSSL